MTHNEMARKLKKLGFVIDRKTSKTHVIVRTKAGEVVTRLSHGSKSSGRIPQITQQLRRQGIEL